MTSKGIDEKGCVTKCSFCGTSSFSPYGSPHRGLRPGGLHVAIFAQLYHWEYTDVVKDVCLSTVFSIVILPLIAALSGLIW